MEQGQLRLKRAARSPQQPGNGKDHDSAENVTTSVCLAQKKLTEQLWEDKLYLSLTPHTG